LLTAERPHGVLAVRPLTGSAPESSLLLDVRTFRLYRRRRFLGTSRAKFRGLVLPRKCVTSACSKPR